MEEFAQKRLTKKSSSSLLDDSEEEEEAEDELKDRRTTGTTWSNTVASRLADRTFARKGSKPTARKVLNMGSEKHHIATSDAVKRGSRDSSEDENVPNFSCQSSPSSTRSSSWRPYGRSFSVHGSLSSYTGSGTLPSLPPRVGRRKEPLQARGKPLHPPLPPNARSLRCNSPALGSPSRHGLRRDSYEVSPLPWMRVNSDTNMENENLLDGEDDCSSRGRKKRRASLQAIPSLSEPSPFLTRRSSLPYESQVPPPIPMAARSYSTSDFSPSKCRSFPDAFGECGRSPSNSSRASSRKRGVPGSPVSDFMDDVSIGGLSASLNSNGSSLRRSRSRILSPPLSLGSPLLLEPTWNAKKHLTLDECRGMDQYHSDDHLDDDQSVGSFHDTSFVASADDNHVIPLITVPAERSSRGILDEEDNTKEQEIFDNMSSYEDLKFLINALRKESSGNSSAFGGTLSWTVAPPATWPGARRSAFFQWVVDELQFTIRPLGNSVCVLQVSKAKGQAVLAKLEAALISYKEKFAANGAHEEEESNINAMLLQSPFGAPVPRHHSSASSKKRCSISKGRMSQCATTEELAADLDKLSMTEDTPRQVGLSLEFGSDFVEVVAKSRSSTDKSTEVMPVLRTSIEESIEVSAKSPRPSFETYEVGTPGIMYHIHGHDSPEMNPIGGRKYARQPRFSLGSIASPHPYPWDSDQIDGKRPKLSLGSVGSGYKSRGRPSVQTPIHSLEVLETPQIKQDEGWGSRPVAGKDWGESQKCDEDLLGTLSVRFDDAIRVAGIRDSMDSFDGLPVMPCGLDLDELVHQEEVNDDLIMKDSQDGRNQRRLRLSFAKYQRVSLWAAASQDGAPLLPGRKSAFPVKPKQNLSLVEEVPRSLHAYDDSFPLREVSVGDQTTDSLPAQLVGADECVLGTIFAFLTESDLLLKVSLVSTTWASLASTAYAALMMASVGYMEESSASCGSIEGPISEATPQETTPVSIAMERDWKYLTSLFPWACFLSCGAFKRVYKVYNSKVKAEEAVSVMDVEAITDKKTIAAELVVTAMLSTLSRRGVCPNFIVMHGVFTLPYDVPESHWGCEDKKKQPNGSRFLPTKKYTRPRQPKETYPGRYQFIRMELCNKGDFEGFLKHQANECLPREVAQASLFQIAFALHAAAERHSLKHYDIKLLNVFVQDIQSKTSDVVLRYGLGSHTFALRLPKEHAFYAKLADYGTANIQAESTGRPVTIAQFTTLENTPPDYLILGDEATQGHEHDNFGLGLSMLHLFTGHAPYEEILEDVLCPINLKKKLKTIWEEESETAPQYSVIRSIILSDVYKDDRGHILEGEPDETLYNTLYRFLVLFGIQEETFEQRRCPVWKAIIEALSPKVRSASLRGTDVLQYEKDCHKYSVLYGTNCFISRARQSLQTMEGGLELLFQLCCFNPKNRATPLQVLNSDFMIGLREGKNSGYCDEDTVFSFSAFSTHR